MRAGRSWRRERPTRWPGRRKVIPGSSSRASSATAAGRAAHRPSRILDGMFPTIHLFPNTMTRSLRLSLVLLLAAVPAWAQGAPASPSAGVAVADSALLTVQRIYGSPEFGSEGFGPARWLEDRSAYTTVERAAEGRGREVVRYDTETGARSVLITAAQ